MTITRKALLLIDIQQGLDQLDYYGNQRNNPEAEANCRRVLELFRTKKWPVFHVKHNSKHLDSPLHPDKPGNEIKPIVSPLADEPVIGKNVNSAFIGTDLQNRLKVEKINELVLVGLTTEHCVSTTARMAANLGFGVVIPADATAAFDKVGANGKLYDAEMIHQISLATLKDEFASITSTDSLIEKLAKG